MQNTKTLFKLRTDFSAFSKTQNVDLELVVSSREQDSFLKFAIFKSNNANIILLPWYYVLSMYVFKSQTQRVDKKNYSRELLFGKGFCTLV